MTTESNQEVLNSNILRARMMNSEYKNLTVEEVKRIYIEETGKEPPAHICVYHYYYYGLKRHPPINSPITLSFLHIVPKTNSE
ncbi:hypothetical protein [Bacillus sp. FJAT-47783]|uniref:hypothetical protein n=1 Tax=Bacillus sp. FJAT-47783 TaxID=2922712 RepID=UPI001FADA701|nr:hypothetical protein [Bacillus sp. FJAT-47783]